VIDDWRAPLLRADASGSAVTMTEEDAADDLDRRVKRALIIAYDRASSIFEKQYHYKRKEAKHLKGHAMAAALLNSANPKEVFPAGEYDEAAQYARHYLKQYTGKQTPQYQSRTKRVDPPDFGAPRAGETVFVDDLDKYLKKYFGKVGEHRPAQLDLLVWWQEHMADMPALYSLRCTC
jgi:hypothetical protein